MALHCPECGFVNTDGANYCQKCGAFLATPEPAAGGEGVEILGYHPDAELTDALRQAGRRSAGIFSDYGPGMQWFRILGKRGWNVPHWPVEWGGTGWTPVQHHLFALGQHVVGIAHDRLPTATASTAPRLSDPRIARPIATGTIGSGRAVDQTIGRAGQSSSGDGYHRDP